jgi:uncharacterized protein
MALELRPNCEYCDIDLPPASADARICSYECTFCADCVADKLHNVCPNCGGGLRQGQFDHLPNGVPAYRLPSDHPRANVSASPLSQPKSRRSRKRSEPSHPRTAEIRFVRSPGARALLTAQHSLAQHAVIAIPLPQEISIG